MSKKVKKATNMSGLDSFPGRERSILLLGADQMEDNLVRACQQGDSAAAEALVDLYWDRVFGYAFRLTRVRIDAEDIAQETFLRAFNSLSKYKPDGQFKAWLLRIATNLFLDQKKAARSNEVVSEDLVRAVAVQSSPLETIDRRELVEALFRVVETLSKEQQVVIMLRGVEDMDYPRIAAILGVKESTARWHMFEAWRILREKLGRKFDLEALRS